MNEPQAQKIDVAAIREELGLSQAGLAHLVGVDQSTVSLWETKKAEPREAMKRWLMRLVEDARSAAA